MVRRIVILSIVLCMLAGSTACAGSQSGIQATETAYQAGLQQTQEAKSTRLAQFTANAQATVRIQETIQAQDTQKVEQTATVVNTTATSEAEGTAIANATATVAAAATGTVAVIQQQTATAKAILRATAQAQPMLDLVNRLVSDGYLSTSQGEYFPMLDFDHSWAQLGWYQFFSTGFSPSDFVISAHTEWDSAIKSTEAETTGCGIVFRENGADNHYLVYLAMNGTAYFTRVYKNAFSLIWSNYYGPVGTPPQGEADIVLAVEGSYVTFFVNGEMVLHQYDDVLSKGSLDYTVISGTNADYGTHCRMTNVNLWVIK